MSILFINLPLILIIIFNKLFLIKYQKKGLVFTEYLYYFIKFTIILTLLILLIFNYAPKIQLSSDLVQGIIILYFLLFICTFLVICTKFTSSPTEIIYSYIKKNKKISILKLKQYIRKKKLIKIRFTDLKKQKLISENKSYIILTKFGKNFIKYFIFLKNFFKVDCVG